MTTQTDTDALVATHSWLLTRKMTNRLLSGTVPCVRYRGWDIGPDYVGWTATSPNYDASYEGPEDGWVDNGEKSWGRDRAECEAGIDEWFEERAE